MVTGYRFNGITQPLFSEYLQKAFESCPNTSPFNATGHPTLSINAGFNDGLPVGMMIVGRMFEDATVLNVAYAYERIRDGKSWKAVFCCTLTLVVVSGTGRKPHEKDYESRFKTFASCI